MMAPQFAHRYSISRLPGLRDLRARFIGRVVHSSEEQWKGDIASLLAFNRNSIDDGEKWISSLENRDSEE
jgi:hypothetical protein